MPHFPAPEHNPSLDEVRQHGWRDRGSTLERTLRFRDRLEAARAGEYVTEKAVDWLRRPDIEVLHNELHVIVANPHNAGVTAAETRLAAKVDSVVDDLQDPRPQ
jgi:pterin-4a-carbinolamine dehydratase